MSIKKLCQAFGVSGYEDKVRGIIYEDIKHQVDLLYEDTLGNLIAMKRGKCRDKLLLTSHMDEIGLIVESVDDKGVGKAGVIGGVYSEYSLCNRVRFESGHTGIVTINDKGDMLIDGCGIKLNVGDVACFEGETLIQNNYVISKALDNRLGCHILIETIKQLTDPDLDVFFAFSVQEELGMRGSGAVAHKIKPDLAINVDITSDDKAKLGDGISIKVKDRSVICDRRVVKLLKDSCEKHNIRHQFDVSNTGGTDTSAVQMSGDGILAGAISVGIKNVHSISETADVRDIDRAIKLLVKLIGG